MVLKHCPFCNGSAVIKQDFYSKRFYVNCVCCGALAGYDDVLGGACFTPKEAADLWNKRSVK